MTAIRDVAKAVIYVKNQGLCLYSFRGLCIDQPGCLERSGCSLAFSFGGIRFFEQTAIASQAWTNGVSDEAFFFGADTVMEAIVIPPEIRGKIPGDFGRDKGVAWYSIEGFASYVPWIYRP